MALMTVMCVKFKDVFQITPVPALQTSLLRWMNPVDHADFFFGIQAVVASGQGFQAHQAHRCCCPSQFITKITGLKITVNSSSGDWDNGQCRLLGELQGNGFGGELAKNNVQGGGNRKSHPKGNGLDVACAEGGLFQPRGCRRCSMAGSATKPIAREAHGDAQLGGCNVQVQLLNRAVLTSLAARTPSSTSCSMRVRRTLTSANSEATK